MKTISVLTAAGTLLIAMQAAALAQPYPPDPAYDQGQSDGQPPGPGYGPPPGPGYGPPPGPGYGPEAAEDQLPPGLHYGPEPAYGDNAMPGEDGPDGAIYGRPGGYPAYRDGGPNGYRRPLDPRYGPDAGDPRRFRNGDAGGPDRPRQAHRDERLHREQDPRMQRHQQRPADEDMSGN